MDKTIILTGGGTAGHVIPNIALIPGLLENDWSIHYIGTQGGIEKKLIGGCEKLTFHAVSSGKLRRYFSLKNFTDPFKVIKGMFQAAGIIKRVKPNVIFSKGGFVSVPVVVGGKLFGVPVVLHESDYTPGLANRLCAPFAKKICVAFEDTLSRVKRNKGVFTGAPIRASLFEGEREKGLEFCGLSGEKPVLLIMGGSSGAASLNEIVRTALPSLLEHFEIIHLCGNGKQDDSAEYENYRAFEYVSEQLPDLLAACDIILSRAGASAAFEFLSLKKPMLLVPLPLGASRGDQIQNARYFERRGYAMVIEQENLNAQTLQNALAELYEQREKYMAAMGQATNLNGTDSVLKVIFETSK